MTQTAEISDHQLRLLLTNADVIRQQEKARARRHEAHKLWHTWLNPDSITNMAEEDLKKKFVEYYETGAHRHPFNLIYRDRIIRNVDKFRKLLSFLFNESLDVRTRLDKILNKKGEYYLEGVGKGLATSFLLDYNPTRYCVWNNKVNMGLEALGLLPPTTKGEKISDRYVKILAISNHIMELSPEPYNNLIDVDHFYHIIAVEPAGKDALSTVLGLKTEELEESPAASVHFSMERGLEEFIAENFAQVFPELELYQDEESSGRQYPTDVGTIDFLAQDRKNGDLVIVELKLGKTSDAVVGQILRYMQWVEENLNDKSSGKVRGVVIAKEQDEKLRYSLRRVPDVDFYSYRVEFGVKRMSK